MKVKFTLFVLCLLFINTFAVSHTHMLKKKPKNPPRYCLRPAQEGEENPVCFDTELRVDAEGQCKTDAKMCPPPPRFCIRPAEEEDAEDVCWDNKDNVASEDPECEKAKPCPPPKEEAAF